MNNILEEFAVVSLFAALERERLLTLEHVELIVACEFWEKKLVVFLILFP